MGISDDTEIATIAQVDETTIKIDNLALVVQ